MDIKGFRRVFEHQKCFENLQRRVLKSWKQFSWFWSCVNTTVVIVHEAAYLDHTERWKKGHQCEEIIQLLNKMFAGTVICEFFIRIEPSTLNHSLHHGTELVHTNWVPF